MFININISLKLMTLGKISVKIFLVINLNIVLFFSSRNWN